MYNDHKDHDDVDGDGANSAQLLTKGAPTDDGKLTPQDEKFIAAGRAEAKAVRKDEEIADLTKEVPVETKKEAA